MTAIITCEQFAEHLADFLEHTADDAMRAQIERHSLSCTECGALLADLRKLQLDAANLPRLSPSRDLWSGIAARIETPVVGLNSGNRMVSRASAAPRRTSRFTPLWIGAAAAGLVGIGVVLARFIPEHSSSTPAPVQTTAAAPAQSTEPVQSQPSATATQATTPTPAPAKTILASNRPTAEETYDVEIRRLRAIITQRRGTLDTATVGVIERNLKIIDSAIAQCREALRKDPASRFLMESLNDALDTKVKLLRTAAMLPART